MALLKYCNRNGCNKLTSLALIFPYEDPNTGDKKYYIYSHSFIPQRRMQEHMDNTDAGSLETINSIIDEILPLNIYFEFALQRQTTIKYKLEDLIFMAFEPAAGENEHCNFDNNITAIKKADYTQSVAGFSYVNSYESAGAFVCGVECCLAMQAPFETQESVVNIETATEAETTPIRTCGEENAIIGEDTPFTMAESAVTVQEDVTAAVTQLKICGTDYAREED